MKKLLSIGLVLLVIMLSACIPKEHDECVETWDYKMVEKNVIFISYTTYVLVTDYGDVTVSKNIYEAAQNNEYKEVCMTIIDENELIFIGATLLDGTPLDQDLVDEVADQVIPELEEYLDEEETTE